MAVDKAALLEDLKAAGIAGAKASGAVLVTKLIPDALDFAATQIPGQIDDMVLAALKPYVISFLNDEIAKLG